MTKFRKPIEENPDFNPTNHAINGTHIPLYSLKEYKRSFYALFGIGMFACDRGLELIDPKGNEYCLSSDLGSSVLQMTGELSTALLRPKLA